MIKIADCPYPGPRAFRQADHDHFFGRQADAEAIADLWRANRLTVISGPVASGKTSLLAAGVYPLMTGGRSDVLPPGSLSHGSTFPSAALPEHNPYTLSLLRSWLPDEVATRLAGLSVGEFVRRRARRHGGVVFAAIDQAEDLLIDANSGSRRAWRRQFLDELAEAVRGEPCLHLLLITRSQALDLITRSVGGGAGYPIAPLTRQAARQAVTGPAEGAGRPFSSDAAEKLLADLQNDDVVEPALLQVACSWLWQNLPSDIDVISARDVRAFGDAETALAAHCGQVIATVAAEHDMTARRLSSWLLDTFVTDQNTRSTAYQGADTTAGLPNPAVSTLVDQHMLTAELKSGLLWYQLLSDRLVEPLRKAPDQRPPVPTPAEYLTAAEKALSLGELGLARRRAKHALSAEPDLRLCGQIYSLLGNISYEENQPAEAEGHYRKAAGLFEAAGDTGAAARQLAAVGQMLLAQGKAAEAVDELHSAVGRVPNDLVVQTELALALWQLGEGRAAVAILTSVLEIDGGNAEALRARGEILADLGDARDAMIDLDRPIVPDRPSTRAARGLVLAELGDHPAANREIDGAMHTAPHSGPVLLYAARASALSGDEISAEELARRAVDATDPPLSPHHRELALRLARQA